MMPHRLPTRKLRGKEYFVDERLGELRAVDNPHDRLDICVLTEEGKVACGKPASPRYRLTTISIDGRSHSALKTEPPNKAEYDEYFGNLMGVNRVVVEDLSTGKIVYTFPRANTMSYIDRQIKYFTKRHKEESKAGNMKDALDYSNRIYFWEREKQRYKRGT